MTLTITNLNVSIFIMEISSEVKITLQLEGKLLCIYCNNNFRMDNFCDSLNTNIRIILRRMNGIITFNNYTK